MLIIHLFKIFILIFLSNLTQNYCSWTEAHARHAKSTQPKRVLIDPQRKSTFYLSQWANLLSCVTSLQLINDFNGLKTIQSLMNNS
jgi:hypothetical protein